MSVNPCFETSASRLLPRIYLSNETIRSAENGSTLWDETVKGLHLRAVSAERKSFYLFYRFKGVQRRPKLGDFGAMTLSQARSLAKEWLRSISQGQDPKGTKDSDKQELTLAGLYKSAWEDHWNKPRFIKSGQAYRTQRIWESTLRKQFGSTKVSEITPLKLKAWMQTMAETPYQANRALETISKMFSHGLENELLPEGKTNPCSVVRSFSEKKRKRFASYEELLRLALALDGERATSPMGVAFIETLFSTGARPRSLENLKRSDLKIIERDGRRYAAVDFSGKVMEMTGTEDTILFPPSALSIIESLPAPRDGTLFGIKYPGKLWKKIRDKANCPDLRIRDSRRTFATIGMSSGIKIDTIGELLNHHSSNTTKRYALLDDDARFVAATTIADKTNELMRGIR